MKFKIVEKGDGRFIPMVRRFGLWHYICWGRSYLWKGGLDRWYSEMDAKTEIVYYLERKEKRMEKKRLGRITINTKVIEV